MVRTAPHAARAVPRRLLALPALAAAGLLATACGSSSPAPASTSDNVTAPAQTATSNAHPLASGDIRSASGEERGRVEIATSGGEIRVEARGLEPGLHGLHLHSVGKCEANSPDPADASKRGDFLSAGGHLAGSGPAHPAHAGDLPPLLIGADGTGTLTTSTDRLTNERELDGDGTALIIHEKPDNFANIPTRYASGGADDETKKAGDAGSRVACAVLTAP